MTDGAQPVSVMADVPEISLRPDFRILAVGTSAAALLSFIYLPWPVSIFSTLLAILMIAGADVDARTFLLPDAVTYGAIILGILSAPLLQSADVFDATNPWLSIAFSVLRAAGTALALAVLRKFYDGFRGQEGLGLGDVKLGGAVGAWLPLDAIPICFGLATTAALLSLAFRWRGAGSEKLKLPFGTFLCPSLWLVFFITSLPQ